MAGKHWSEPEHKIIKSEYSNVNISLTKENLLAKLPGRTWDAIKLKAEKLKIKQVYPSGAPEGNIKALLEENLQAYYWTGFIMADGCIQNGKRLALVLSLKDEQHLISFAEFISCKNIKRRANGIGVHVQDPINVPLFAKKFDIKQNKTENPPTLNLVGNNFLSFLAGFIDGDGSIGFVHKRTDTHLTIKCHKNWLNVFKYFEQRLYNLCGYPRFFTFLNSKINNSGYAVLSITDNTILRNLKKQLLKLSLPLMSRKWDKIKENDTSRYEISDQRRVGVKQLFNGGKKQKEICSILNISPTTVSLILSGKRQYGYR
jgi:hypothetical protein